MPFPCPRAPSRDGGRAQTAPGRRSDAACCGSSGRFFVASARRGRGSGVGGYGLRRMGLREVTVMTSQPLALRAAWLASLVLSLLVALCGCVGPSWSETDYEEKVANTAEAARSAVQTARLVVEAAEGGKAPGPYTARALSDAETALTSIATHIGSVQPPTMRATALRSRVTSLLTECRTALADLRIAVRDGRFDDLARLAEPLPRLGSRLKRLESRSSSGAWWYAPAQSGPHHDHGGTGGPVRLAGVPGAGRGPGVAGASPWPTTSRPAPLDQVVQRSAHSDVPVHSRASMMELQALCKERKRRTGQQQARWRQ